MPTQTQWKPACDLKHLRLRAQMLTTIRTFFYHRSVLEVETPLLCHATGTDPQLDFFSSFYHGSTVGREMFLQTSPEFAMKRLLAAGSGSIFQICKAFRNGEAGRFHNPEFSILEWYRVGFTLHQLMDEVVELFEVLLDDHCMIESTYRVSYSELFEQVTGLNPLVFCQKSYGQYASENSIGDAISICGNDHSMWLDFLFSHKVQPVLANQTLSMVFGYPAIQSSLARISQENTAVADRFEVFINGIEIGNGFFELSNADEQEQRFDQEKKARTRKGLIQVEKDQLFLDALRFGLPDCSGIALGLDRLLMVIANADSLNDVLAFPFDRA
ncbi:MAG: EF-P lysine aminoacylase GenX [Methylococcales bacterium]|nr:EF-P lysine aminoacylase GenX [Methylococcales bacterium]